MPRAEKGSSRDVANKMKAKGLGRLRWYCQVCQKQCRDENGFKCHAQSEGHLRAMLVVGEHAGRHIASYSSQFQHDFVQLLSRRWGTKRVKANNVYQELISDKNHSHMNATRWVTLTEFCKFLGRAGIAKVEDTEKGIFIAWIDNSPKTLSKQAANQARERLDMDDEQRQRKMIEEQIERAREAEAEAGPVPSGSGTSSSDDVAAAPELPVGPIAPISIGIAPRKLSPDSAAAAEGSSSGSTSEPIKLGGGLSLAKHNPLKLNPLKAGMPKPGNALKGGSSSVMSSAASTSGASSVPSLKRPAPMSAVEALYLEEMERKRRRESSTWSGARGHGEVGLQRGRV